MLLYQSWNFIIIKNQKVKNLSNNAVIILKKCNQIMVGVY